MTTIFITRHAGARAWAEQEGFQIDHVLDHLDIETVEAGDRILGTLPVNLVADVCKRGARYFHLSIEIPPAQRGRELTPEEMREFGARLEEYSVKRL